MKKYLLCLCLFSSASYANQCAVIDAELAAAYADMKTYGSYRTNYNYEKYESAAKRFNDALDKIATLGGKHCNWTKTIAEDVDLLTSADKQLEILSWDWQSGGSMHDYGSFWRYRLPNGTWKTKFNEDDGSIRRVFNPVLNGKPYYFIESAYIASSCIYGISGQFYQITPNGLEEAPLIQGKKLISDIYTSYISTTNSDLPTSNAYIDYDLKQNRFSFPLVLPFSESCGDGKMTSKRIYYRFDGERFVKEKKVKK
ncbi:MAG: hypothetical protein KH899_07630 [Haemophilus pittmaniae]|uniref:hypothetical protein n=1 Tax=Haemophilus pittmaniae TaxID=249188 RepID=UPI0023F3383E|nr:hypothetical protein [Haemophilus pittmaniae]MBS6027436.1 hypothetical protein [Haemophilus pittmaniae]